MLEGCWAILFNHEVCEPSKGVAANETNREVIPGATPDEPDEQCDAERSAYEMQKSRERQSMLLHVKIPELCVVLDHLLHKEACYGLSRLPILFTIIQSDKLA